jgi:hypothetical protein
VVVVVVVVAAAVASQCLVWSTHQVRESMSSLVVNNVKIIAKPFAQAALRSMLAAMCQTTNKIRQQPAPVELILVTQKQRRIGFFLSFCFVVEFSVY